MTDTTKRIIHPHGNTGGIAVMTPCECGLTVETIAKKDVPPGVPYLIINVSDLPADYTFIDAWEADFSSPHGHGIGPDISEWKENS